MTNEEALIWFKDDLKSGKCSDECPQCNAMEKAIVALDKQIPKKVTKSACPSCNRIFLFRHSEKRKGDYCDNCGQALDWSDDNA